MTQDMPQKSCPTIEMRPSSSTGRRDGLVEDLGAGDEAGTASLLYGLGIAYKIAKVRSHAEIAEM